MAMATAYFASIFIDRWHPLRIVAYSSITAIVFGISNFIWVFVTLEPSAFFWLHIMGAGIIGVFGSSVTIVAGLPFDMRLHPKSRFTQFCSAQTLLRSGCTMFAGILGGLYFDSIKWFFGGSDFAYRFGFAWTAFWTIISAALIYSLYRQWHALGGDKHFHVPAPWSPTGFEEQEQSNYVGPQTKWLRINMIIIRGVMLLSILYLIPLSYWLWQMGWRIDFQWHVAVILPVSVALLVWWLAVERGLKSDMARCRAGKIPRNGIPHHGVLFIKSCALLLLLGIWFGKTIAAVNAGLEGGVLVLGVANLITNALFIVTFLVLRRMERGHPPLLDYDGYAEAGNPKAPNARTQCEC
jgi:MFS family permease